MFIEPSPKELLRSSGARYSLLSTTHCAPTERWCACCGLAIDIWPLCGQARFWLYTAARGAGSLNYSTLVAVDIGEYD